MLQDYRYVDCNLLFSRIRYFTEASFRETRTQRRGKAFRHCLPIQSIRGQRRVCGHGDNYKYSPSTTIHNIIVRQPPKTFSMSSGHYHRAQVHEILRSVSPIADSNGQDISARKVSREKERVTQDIVQSPNCTSAIPGNGRDRHHPARRSLQCGPEFP